jgi:hypothetical protein
MTNTQGTFAPANEFDPRTNSQSDELLLEALTLLAYYEWCCRVGSGAIDTHDQLRTRHILNKADREVPGFMWRSK